MVLMRAARACRVSGRTFDFKKWRGIAIVEPARTSIKATLSAIPAVPAASD